MSVKSGSSFSTDTKQGKPVKTWSEWNDLDYNSIHWELYNKEKPVSEKLLYTDSNENLLPYSLQSKVVGWERTYNFFQNVPEITLYQQCEMYKFPNLIELNFHLMKSPLMRLIISSFGIAQFLGDRYPTKMPHFFQSSQVASWRPWFHLYTNGKIKKDAPMDPFWNANGLCIARLYYGGVWYLIRMDDYIPIDREGRALLPMIQNANKNTDVVVLWPIFLTKALLKIAALSWTEHSEIVDFSPIHCLTGWIYEKIDIDKDLEKMDIWNICRPYAAEYAWDIDDKMETGSRKSKSKASTKRNNSAQSATTEKQVFLCVLLKDMSFVDAEHAIPIAPSFGHLCYVDQTRNCQLEKPERMLELEPWKSYRWLSWARERGIYPPDPFDQSTYAFEILTTFRKSLALNELEVEEEEMRTIMATPVTEKGSKKGDRKSSKAAGPPPIISPLIWCSFNNFHKYFIEIHIFFIPGSFQANWLISPKPKEVEKKAKPKSGAASVVDTESGKQTETLTWPNKLLLSKNCPIYLFTDSLTTKFILFSLQHQNVRFPLNSSGNSVEANSSNTYNTYRSKASILVEKFMFDRNEIGDLEFFMNTMGVTSKSISLPQGRFVFRIWLKSETPYVLIILSNRKIFLGPYIDICERMSEIPLRLQELASTFSNAFSMYFNALGYDDFKECMHEFYQIIRPDLIRFDKKLKLQLNEAIVEVLYDLCKLFDKPSKMKHALDILFIPKLSSYTVQSYKIKNHIEYNAASKIQAMFKGYHVRKLKEPTIITHPNYEEIQMLLHKFYERFFNVANRLWTVPSIFLAFMKKTGVYDYSFYSDYLFYIVTYNFENPQRLKVEANSWAPLVMCDFKVTKSIFLRIDMKTELTSQVVRVFNNDTGDEMARNVGSVNPQVYDSNVLGYTALAYGWNLEQTDLSENLWNFQIAHLFTEDLDPMLIDCNFQDCFKQQLEGVYTPNHANNLCSCYIYVKGSCNVVIRIGTSYDSAKIHAQLMTSNGEVISELSGEHGVVLPPIVLEHVDNHETKNELVKDPILESLTTFLPDRDIQEREISAKQAQKETRYYLKVYMLDNSWPCTNIEWLGIQEYKNSKLIKVQIDDSKKSSVSSIANKIDSKKIIGSKKIPKHAPTWTINVLSNEPLSITHDVENDERILQMKVNWESKNPGRLLRGTKLRENFLKHFPQNDLLMEQKQEKKSKVSKSTSLPQANERTFVPKSREIPRLHWNEYKKTSKVYDFIKELLLETNKRILTTDKFWYKTREDEEFRHIIREYNVQDFQKRSQMLNNYMEAFLNDYSKRFCSVYIDLEENLLKSYYLTLEAYDARKFIYDQGKLYYLRRQESERVENAERDGKSKKDQKDKKEKKKKV